jgi:asparagine synthase (glutamine-hydrolysing)
MVDDLLSPSRVQERGLFRPEAVRRFVDEHRSGRQDWSLQLWQFLTLELWMQTFLDGGARKFEGELLQTPQVATA